MNRPTIAEIKQQMAKESEQRTRELTNRLCEVILQAFIDESDTVPAPNEFITALTDATRTVCLNLAHTLGTNPDRVIHRVAYLIDPKNTRPKRKFKQL